MHLYHHFDTVENPAFITFWSFIHLLSGILLYVFISFAEKATAAGTHLPPWFAVVLAFVIHLFYECKDFFYSYVSEVKPTNSNSLLNSIGDQVCGSLGILLAYASIDKTTKRDVLYTSMVYCSTFLIARATYSENPD